MSQFQPLQLEPLASEPTIPSLEKGTESSPDLEPVEKFPTRQTLEPIDRGETSKLTGKARAQELWQKVRDVYKPKRRTSRFYALYKRVMEDKIKAYREFEALNIPPGGWRRPQRPAESEDTTTEEEEEKQEKKQRKQWRKLRVSQVFRREPEKVEINEKVEIEKVRDITGMELAENLIAWMNNMGIDLKVLADKICVVDKTEEDLIQELSLLIATALFTKTGNDCSWPKYEDWRMVLLNDGTAPSAHLYWQALRERKSEFSNVIHDEDMLKLVFCRNPHQRQKLLREMNRIFRENLQNIETYSYFSMYLSVSEIFDLKNRPRFRKQATPQLDLLFGSLADYQPEPEYRVQRELTVPTTHMLQLLPPIEKKPEVTAFVLQSEYLTTEYFGLEPHVTKGQEFNDRYSVPKLLSKMQRQPISRVEKAGSSSSMELGDQKQWRWSKKDADAPLKAIEFPPEHVDFEALSCTGTVKSLPAMTWRRFSLENTQTCSRTGNLNKDVTQRRMKRVSLPALPPGIAIRHLHRDLKVYNPIVYDCQPALNR